MKSTFILVSFIFALFFSASGYGKTFLFDQSTLYLGPYLSAYETKDDTINAKTVLAKNNLKNFIDLKQIQPSFGYSNSNYWLTAVFHSKKNQLTFLEIANPRLNIVDFYFYQGENLIYKVNTGDQRPFSTRSVDHHNFVFPLTLEEYKNYSVLIRVKSSDNLFLPITLSNESAYYQDQSLSSLTYGFFYGTLVIMIIINLLIFITLQDRKYLMLSLFLFCFGLALFSLNGLATRFLWSESVWWGKQSLTFLESVALLFGLIFTRSFLNTRHYSPISDKCLSLFILVAAMTIILAIFVDYRWSKIIISTIAFIIPVIALYSAYICWRKKYRPARYFLIAWSIFLLSIIVYGLMMQQLLPSNIYTQYGMHVGLIWLAVMLSLALTDRFNHLMEQKEQAQFETIKQQRTSLNNQKQMMDSISRFVPTQFLNLLERSDVTDIKYGDATLKNMFIMFTDIRGFTSLSENMTPEENLTFLNSYLKFMEPVIEQNQGFIDKFIGDAIMALFPNTADQAIHAAIEMQQQLHFFNIQLQSQGHSPIKIGIGIHGGNVMLGTVGSDARLETTVIGDVVNLTSRIENLTKKLQASIIISEHTFNALQNPTSFSIRQLDDVFIRGKANTVKIYQVLVPESKKSQYNKG